MNTMDETTQVVNFLLAACKQKDNIIEQLKAQVAKLTPVTTTPVAADKPE